MRTQRWKLYSDGHFFDVTNDPGEEKPLDTVALPADAKDAYEALSKARTKFVAPEPVVND